jgi:hypothetical protein
MGKTDENIILPEASKPAGVPVPVVSRPPIVSTGLRASVSGNDKFTKGGDYDLNGAFRVLDATQAALQDQRNTFCKLNGASARDEELENREEMSFFAKTSVDGAPGPVISAGLATVYGGIKIGAKLLGENTGKQLLDRFKTGDCDTSPLSISQEAYVATGLLIGWSAYAAQYFDEAYTEALVLPNEDDEKVSPGALSQRVGAGSEKAMELFNNWFKKSMTRTNNDK